MVNAWRRFWDGSTRHWRAEGKEAGGVATPKLRLTRKAPGTADPAATRMLFVNQYYWPDHASTAQHLTDLVESLAARGYECHVLCGRGAYQAGRPPLPAHEVHHGVQIHRVGATAFGRRSTLRRMADYLSFYANAALRALALPRFDVVATLTTPPILGLLGTALKRLKGSAHVFWSMDLHPDASLALGKMSPRSPVVKLLGRLSDLAYRNADRVVVLGPYMADRIAAKRVLRDRMVAIPVWSRRDEVYPVPRAGHPLRKSLGLDGKFVAMYSGNLGLAHCFDEFLEAARRLRHRDDFVFLFVGEGPRLEEVREAKRREGLENVRLLDYFPREQLHLSLSVADVHLISMRREMTGIVVPGKLYGAMASGRPTIFVGPEHCESADAIRDADCGHAVRLGDPDALIEALAGLAADPDRAAALGARARAAFLDLYEKDTCCARWGWMLGELVAPRRSVPITGRMRPAASISGVRPAGPLTR